MEFKKANNPGKTAYFSKIAEMGILSSLVAANVCWSLKNS